MGRFYHVSRVRDSVRVNMMVVSSWRQNKDTRSRVGAGVAWQLPRLGIHPTGWALLGLSTGCDL
jgi:hypothetical protein